MNISGVKLTRLVDAATEPIALSDAVNWLRVEITDDNTLISDLITAARLECEQRAARSFIATTWQLTLDYLPMSAGPFPGFPWPFGGGSGYPGRSGNNGVITLPMPPLISVSAVEYLDYSGTLQTLSPSAYVTNPGTPGTLFPTFGTFFPLSQPIPSAVKISYVAGYGPDATFVPKSTMLALRFLIGHYYNHRTSNVEVPDAVQNLLDIDRSPRSG